MPGHGTLWIVGALGAGINIPYTLMLMGTSEPVEGPVSVPPRRPVTFADPPATSIPEEAAAPTEAGASPASAFASAKLPAHSADLDALDDMGLAANKPRSAMPARRLMYAKSGYLVNPLDYSRSWSKKAGMSLTVFGGMVALLNSRMDNLRPGGYAPF
ncbi:hypothetical protein QBZ16_002529 [Prototheca wickerhamii]|uniref:Uncharacterized protein n=1 Tax=Prototheca wickerhamii TaxID=3111 RepID=A0AAD9MMT1_PROWI|nr:hypothetical protein QBZ16_002529 [Prototheca wickerhamii]